MNEAPVIQRILLECTATSQQDAHRGIPRVVRGVVRHAALVSAELGVAWSPLAYALGSWSCGSWSRPGTEWLGGLPHRVYLSAAERFCATVPSRLLRRWLLPQPGHAGIWKGPRTLARGAGQVRRRFLKVQVRPGAGDVFVLLDTWLKPPPRFWQQLASARSRGARVGAVIYDLIPLTHPHLVGQQHHESFGQWLDLVAAHVDFFVAISKTVRHEVQAYLAQRRRNRDWPHHQFAAFGLGAELAPPGRGTIRDHVRAALAAGRVYLMVGAIEPARITRYYWMLSSICGAVAWTRDCVW